MKNLETTLKALYRDLRNKRLLPVVAILLVAIFVVPIALGTGGATTPPETELAVGIKPLVSTSPVVVSATPELRNFHQRLNEFAKKNPFHQPEAPATSTKGSGGGSGSDSSTTASTDASAAAGSIPPIPGTTDSTGITTGTTDSTGTTTGTTDTTGTTTTGTTDPGTTGSGDTTTTPTDSGSTSPSDSTGTESSSTDILSHQIDVSAGPVGQEENLTGVESLDFLPDVKHPVLQYVTSSPNGLKASFVVSSNVVRVVGDGRCSPNPNDCQFLQLKIGQAERLDYGTDNGLYRVKLLAITQILNPLKKLSAAAGDVSGRIGFSAGLPSTDTSFTPAG